MKKIGRGGCGAKAAYDVVYDAGEKQSEEKPERGGFEPQKRM